MTCTAHRKPRGVKIGDLIIEAIGEKTNRPYVWFGCKDAYYFSMELKDAEKLLKKLTEYVRWAKS